MMRMLMISQTAYNHLPQPEQTTDDVVGGDGDDHCDDNCDDDDDVVLTIIRMIQVLAQESTPPLTE